MQLRLLFTGALFSIFSSCFTSPQVLDAAGGGSLRIEAQMACPDGITFSSPITTGHFASMFPVGGPIDLHGGTLVLEQDLHAASGATLHTAGSIDGQGRALFLPPTATEHSFPATRCCAGRPSVNTCDLAQPIGAVAWQKNSTSPLLAIAGSKDDGVLSLGKPEGTAFNIETDAPLTAGARVLSWHPLRPCGVLGTAAQTEHSTVQLFSYDEVSNTLSLKEVDEQFAQATAVAWQRDGAHVAVALHDGSPHILVYRYEANSLTLVAQVVGPGSAKIYDMAWNMAGDRLAIGLGYALGQPELATYAFTGEALTQHATVSIAAHVSSVTYSPSDTDCIVIGLAGGGGNERVRLYTEEGHHLVSPVRGGQYPVGYDVYDMSWSPNGNLLGLIAYTGREVGEAKETAVVMYERIGDALHKRLEHVFAMPRYKMSWASGDEPTVACIDSAGGVTVLSLKEQMYLRDLTVAAQSAVKWTVPVQAEGIVVWDAAGNNTTFAEGIDLADDTMMIVRHTMVQDSNALRITGSDRCGVQFENCTLPRLGVDSQVPLRCSKQVRLSGKVTANIHCLEGSTLQLIGGTALVGIIEIDDNVMIKGQGHTFDVSQARFVVAAGASLTIRDATVRGLQSDALELQDDSVVVFENGTCHCRDEITLAQGTVVAKRQEFTCAGATHMVAEARYEAAEGVSCIAAVAAVVAAMPVAPAPTPSVDPDASMPGHNGSGVYVWPPGLRPGATPLPSGSLPTPTTPSSTNPSQTAGATNPVPSVSSPMPATPVSPASTTHSTPNSPALSGGPGTIPPHPATPAGVMISSSTYTLTHDLHLSPQTPLVVTKSCVIHANNHTISCYNGAPGCIRLAPGVRVVLQQAQVVEVSPETCERHARSELVWGDGSIVLFARGGQLQQQWHVRGAVTFFGNAATLSFGEAGGIVLEPDTRLVLNTCVLRGVNAQTISCLGMNTTLALAHSALQLHGDWLMSAGAFEVLYDSAIVGPYTLRYRTNEQSRIAPHATLRFADGLYFSYEPAGERIDGLVAEDMTSSLFVDSATIGTSTVAWHYRQGRLLLNGSLEGFGGGIVLTGTNFVPRSARVYWAGSVVV